MLRRVLFSRMKMLTINLLARHPPAPIVGRNVVNVGRMFPWVCRAMSCGKGSIVSIKLSSGQGLDRCLCTQALPILYHQSTHLHCLAELTASKGRLSARSRLGFSVTLIALLADIFWDGSVMLTAGLYLTETDISCQILTFWELWGQSESTNTESRETLDISTAAF